MSDLSINSFIASITFPCTSLKAFPAIVHHTWPFIHSMTVSCESLPCSRFPESNSYRALFKKHFAYSINFVAAKLNGCSRFHAKTLVAVRSGYSGRQAIFEESQNGTAPSMTTEYANPRLTMTAPFVLRLLVNSTFRFFNNCQTSLPARFEPACVAEGSMAVWPDRPL